jgi:hypothetical protein
MCRGVETDRELASFRDDDDHESSGEAFPFSSPMTSHLLLGGDDGEIGVCRTYAGHSMRANSVAAKGVGRDRHDQVVAEVDLCQFPKKPIAKRLLHTTSACLACMHANPEVPTLPSPF